MKISTLMIFGAVAAIIHVAACFTATAYDWYNDFGEVIKSKRNGMEFIIRLEK